MSDYSAAEDPWGDREAWQEINFQAREAYAADVYRRELRDRYAAMTTREMELRLQQLPVCAERLTLTHALELRYAAADAAADALERQKPRRGAAA